MASNSPIHPHTRTPMVAAANPIASNLRFRVFPKDSWTVGLLLFSSFMAASTELGTKNKDLKIKLTILLNDSLYVHVSHKKPHCKPTSERVKDPEQDR